MQEVDKVAEKYKILALISIISNRYLKFVAVCAESAPIAEILHYEAWHPRHLRNP